MNEFDTEMWRETAKNNACEYELLRKEQESDYRKKGPLYGHLKPPTLLNIKWGPTEEPGRRLKRAEENLYNSLSTIVQLELYKDWGHSDLKSYIKEELKMSTRDALIVLGKGPWGEL